MSSKRGLGGGVLGAHLGMAVPQLVRRNAEPVEDVHSEGTEGRVVAPVPDPPAPEQDEHEEDTRRVVIASEPVRAGAALETPPSHDLRPPALDDDDDDHVDDEPSMLRPDRKGPRPAPKARLVAGSVYRVGTQKNPYERRDGIRTQKVTFTAPHGMKREIERFCLDQDMSRSEWIAAVLQREMDRVRRAGKKA